MAGVGEVIRVTGLKELELHLKELDSKLAGRIVRGALRGGAGIAAKAIRGATYTTVGRRTGLLKAGMKVGNVKRPKPPGQPAVGVYAKPASAGFINRLAKAGKLRTRKSKKNGGGRTATTAPYYWRMIEFGTPRMSARPYVERAFGSVATQMLEEYRRRIEAGIEKHGKRR